MGGEYIGAYFFVPSERRPPSDDELFEKLGCDLARSTFGPEVFVERRIEVLSDHVCAQLYFLRRGFMNALTDAPDQEPPLERDPLLPFALAIRDGAVRAGAEVAFLETRNYKLDSVFDNYWMVIARDAGSLAAEWYGLLYMDDGVAEGWAPGSMLLNRDELPGGPGRTLFAGRAGNRWI